MLPKSKSFSSRTAWRAWLKKNYRTSTGLWVKLNKKHVGRGLQYTEAVEEALCYGWIDGQLRRIDDSSHQLRFSPRRAGSVWAPSNIARVKRLINEKRMTPAGLALFKQKKIIAGPAMSVPFSLVLPPDLKKALMKKPVALKHFRGYPKSFRRTVIWWVKSAKHPETRERRIGNIVTNAAKNEKAGY